MSNSTGNWFTDATASDISTVNSLISSITQGLAAIAIIDHLIGKWIKLGAMKKIQKGEVPSDAERQELKDLINGSDTDAVLTELAKHTDGAKLKAAIEKLKRAL